MVSKLGYVRFQNRLSEKFRVAFGDRGHTVLFVKSGKSFSWNAKTEPYLAIDGVEYMPKKPMEFRDGDTLMLVSTESHRGKVRFWGITVSKTGRPASPVEFV